MWRRTSRDEVRSQGKQKENWECFFFFLLSERGRTNKAPSRVLPLASQGDCATINHQDLNGEQSAEEGGGAELREL